jgi:hypothetical protein
MRPKTLQEVIEQLPKTEKRILLPSDHDAWRYVLIVVENYLGVIIRNEIDDKSLREYVVYLPYIREQREIATVAYDEGEKSARYRIFNKINDLSIEFGDNAEECLKIIGEYVNGSKEQIQ